jgi:uncharacterized membrane protein
MTDGLTLATIVGMGIVTYATRAGGIWAIQRIDVSDRTETALAVLPGAILVSLVAPEVVFGGAPEWVAAVAVLLVAIRTGSIVLAMAVGMGVVWLVRNGVGGLV